MSSFPLVVSYYTKDTMYQLEAHNLIASCEKWNIPHHVEAIDSFGSWELNCAYKPFFLISKLQEFKRPIFWIDIDAIFVKSPLSLPEFEGDLAVRINASLPDNHPSKVMSGSIFANTTPGAFSLLKMWAAKCYQQLSDPERTEEFWDQTGLRDVILAQGPATRVIPLSPAYAAIAEHPEDQKNVLDPVILHYQASRRYKKMINEGV